MKTKNITEITYSDGSYTEYGWYENGQKEYKCNYNAEGEKEGKQYRWAEDGTPMED